MDLGAPRCAFFRRKNAPTVLSKRCSALAAKRNAAAARLTLGLAIELITLPPVARLGGAVPNCQLRFCSGLGVGVAHGFLETVAFFRWSLATKIPVGATPKSAINA